MSEMNDGGFPMVVGGLTLRDYFAGQAPEAPDIPISDAASILGVSAEAYVADLPTNAARYLAWWSYCYADAMLAARSEGRKDGGR